jgi:hypothetical protein
VFMQRWMFAADAAEEISVVVWNVWLRQNV